MLLFAAALIFLTAPALDAQDDELPDGKGKETVEHTCTECHGLDKIFAKLRPAAEWDRILRKMRSEGATMSDAEFDTVLKYLIDFFGEDERKKPAASKAAPGASRKARNPAR